MYGLKWSIAHYIANNSFSMIGFLRSLFTKEKDLVLLNNDDEGLELFGRSIALNQFISFFFSLSNSFHF